MEGEQKFEGTESDRQFERAYNDDIKLYATFEDHDRFITLRDQLLAVDLYTEPSGDADRLEWLLHRNITLIVSPISYATSTSL